jgi:F0F1-type ATP synthase membrane subunit c/vacuolar-type H+-ATPase subunit K
MRVAVKLHALLAAIGIALIGVEAVGSISHHPSPLQVKVELTGSQA